MSPYLKNVWYLGAWSNELEDGPVARKVCDEDIVFYRTESGNVAAMRDRCPHRFVPLSAGWVEGENIRCPYHGLLFGPNGQCVERPNDDGPMQPGLCVRAFPAVEKYAGVWIWMGDEALANPELIPDFSYHSDTEHFDNVFFVLHMKCNHQMVSDNILDLSHVHFLHPEIRPEVGFENFKNYVKTDGNTVWSMLEKPGYVPGAFQRSLWGSDSPRADGHGHTRWDAPSSMLAHTALNEVGGDPDDGCRLYNSHIITPETETTSHYFYCGGRTVWRNDPEMDKLMSETVANIFKTQDGKMLEAQQAALGDEVDFIAMKPVILKADAAGMLARRMFRKMLKAEHEGQFPHVSEAAE